MSLAGLSHESLLFPRFSRKGREGSYNLRRRRRKVYSGANAVNEEDPERDRATQMPMQADLSLIIL
jgi:hypothetical protein